MVVFVGELLGNVANASPVFNYFLCLPAQLDKESTCENFSIVAISNEVYRIDFHVEDDLERSRVVVFDFEEFVLGKSFFHILLSGIEVAFNEVKRYVFNLILQLFDLLDELFLFRENKLLFLVLSVHLNLWQK